MYKKETDFVLKSHKVLAVCIIFLNLFRFEDTFFVSSFSLSHKILQYFGSFGQNLKYFWSVYLELCKCTWPGHVILLFEKMRGLFLKIETESLLLKEGITFASVTPNNLLWTIFLLSLPNKSWLSDHNWRSYF